LQRKERLDNLGDNMNKKMIRLLIIMLLIAFTSVGCAQVEQIEVVNTLDQAKTLTPSPDKSSEETSFVKWNGTWDMGDEETTGSSSSLVIINASESQFEFSISAAYVSNFINENGEEVLNPHLGEIEGAAYYVSPCEAHYTTEEEPEYKMVFKMSKDNQINVEEINVNTGLDFGYSPMAGLNVRYFGEYTK
jgi:hypothetical protein